MELALLLLGSATVATPVYLAACAIYPYVYCRCNGGEVSSGRVFRTCRRCGGTGRHLRAGARLLGRRK